MADPQRDYPDLHEHLAALQEAGLLRTIDRPIDKDSELHPLVRWQFVGGLAEAERKAFLFTNIRDGRGRSFSMPVVVGAIAANRAIYSIGMGAPVAEIQAKWDRAIAHPVPPRVVNKAPCQDVVLEGAALQGEGHGLDLLPIPISTPGFDSAPTLTATNVITRDPETGVQNMGTYRAALKAPDRLVVRMATRVGGAGGYQHYLKHQKRGDKTMPCAIVLGCPPYVAFLGPQKLPLDIDEFTVAGGLAGRADQRRARPHRRPSGAGRGRAGDRGADRHRISRAGGAVRRIARPCRARGVQHADAGDGDHPPAQSDHSLLYQPGGAERIERHQARRLRAAVPRPSARHARHPRRDAGGAARAADRPAARHDRSRSRAARRRPRSGGRCKAPPPSRAIAARSASRSTRTSIPTMPTRCCGRWPIA